MTTRDEADGYRAPSGGAAAAADGEADDWRQEVAEPGKGFWVAFAVGWVCIIIGLFGIFDHQSAAKPFNVFRLLIGLNIVNDAVVVPIVLGLAFVVGRWAPRWLIAPMQSWLMISGIVCLYAYPLVGGFGKKPSQPSELPFDYAHNLLIVLGCITLLCGGLAIRSWRRAHRIIP